MCWMSWFEQVMESLHETRDPKSDHTLLTGRIAFLLADATSELVSEGKIPCQSPASASQWLRDHSWKLFDHAEREKPSVEWFRSEFANLLPAVVERYARALKLDRAGLAPLLECLHRYASLSAVSAPASDRRESQRAFLEDANVLKCQGGEAGARSGLEMIGRLVSLQIPLVLVFDDLDWFYRDEASALRLARMLSEFGRLVPNSFAIISINEDNWKQTFEKGLPEAVQDRLTSSVCRFEGVPRGMWAEFLATRAMDEQSDSGDLKGLIAAVERAYPNEATLMPRTLIRAASKAWGELAPMKESLRVAKSEPESTSEISEVLLSESNSEPVIQWADAIGNLRSLIHSRESEPPKPGRTAQPETPFIDVSSSSESFHSEEKKPELTPEFRSFLSSLRARATDKTGYLPQAQDEAERARLRSELILHGRSPDEPKSASQGEEPSLKVRPMLPVIAPEEIAARLRAIKVSLADANADSLEVSQTKLRRMIQVAGTLFPAIMQDTIGSPNDPLSDLRWRFQQNEVNFGFRPYEDTDYWQRNVAETADRARDLRQRDMTRMKLVVFGHANEGDIFPSWDVTEDAGNDLQFCDVILLTDHQLRSVYAVDRLLENEDDPEQREKLFAQVSGEIDFFWKVVTRPVWTLVSPLNRATH